MLTSIFWKTDIVFAKLNLFFFSSRTHSKPSITLTLSFSLLCTLYGDATTPFSLSLSSLTPILTITLTLFFLLSHTTLLTLILILGHERLVFYKCLFLCLVLMVMVSKKLGLILSFDDFQFSF